MDKTVLIGVGTAVLSAAAGAISGYFFAKHRLEKEYAHQLQDELESTKAYYARMYKKDEFSTPEQAVQALVPEEAAAAMLKYQGQIVNYQAAHASDPAEQLLRNIFTEQGAVDIDKEIAARTEEAPYIISVKEFSENEDGYQQNTLTWYEGDQVLADEKDEHIPNVDEAIGLNNLPRFGHRSEDPNTLFVRNDALEIDFEIVRKPGSYREIVLGMTD